MKHSRRKMIVNLTAYAGQWVALTSDQTAIIGHSRNLRTALKQAHKTGEKIPHLVKSPTVSTASVIY